LPYGLGLAELVINDARYANAQSAKIPGARLAHDARRTEV